MEKKGVYEVYSTIRVETKGIAVGKDTKRKMAVVVRNLTNAIKDTYKRGLSTRIYLILNLKISCIEKKAFRRNLLKICPILQEFEYPK